MSNMEWWDKMKMPPKGALKEIQAGRLKGKSDINPQWRYQVMTETFGPCGIGWKYTIERLWTEPGTDGQVFAFAQVNLYHYHESNTEWSDPIPGIGGSMLIEKEKNGLHDSDEGFKMAVTDALSVALKMLGVAAEIYLGNADGSKYQKPATPPTAAPHPAQAKPLTETQTKYFPRVKAALDTLYGSDTATKKAEIKTATAFQGANGIVAGVEDYRVLDGKRLEVLAHKLEAAVKEREKNNAELLQSSTERTPG